MVSRYASAHDGPKGPGDARPKAFQIVQDENRLGKLDGKAIFITGCSSGIGIETARALYQTGATLYLSARDVDKVRQAMPELSKSSRVHLCNLT